MTPRYFGLSRQLTILTWLSGIVMFDSSCGSQSPAPDIADGAATHEQPFVIGTDDRTDVYVDQNSSSPTLRTLASLADSVASVWVVRGNNPVAGIFDNGDGTSMLGVVSGNGMCASAPFAYQVQGYGMGASSFLIGPDLIATANHVNRTIYTKVLFQPYTNDRSRVRLKLAVVEILAEAV